MPTQTRKSEMFPLHDGYDGKGLDLAADCFNAMHDNEVDDRDRQFLWSVTRHLLNKNMLSHKQIKRLQHLSGQYSDPPEPVMEPLEDGEIDEEAAALIRDLERYENKLDDWQARFLDSVRDYVVQDGLKLTTKQRKILERILHYYREEAA